MFIKLARNRLIITLLVLGGSAIIFLFGEFLGARVSARAGFWLGATMVTLSWVTFKWICGDFSEVPGAIKLSAVAAITAMIGWTTFLLYQ